LKVLFVHEVSYTKKPIYEMHEFPEYLSKNGHEVVFFEFDEGSKFWNKGSSASKISQGRVLEDAKVSIERPFQLGIPGVDRLFVVLSSIPKLRNLLKFGGFDVVVLYAVPTYGIQTILLAKNQRVPVVFRALDVSHKIRSSFLAPLIKLVERYVYRKANLLSANNPAMEDYCRGLAGSKIVSAVHYPPLDVEHFTQLNRDQELRKSLGIKETDKVICYMGTFFYFSGLVQALTQFASRLNEEPTMKLLLIGGGEQNRELRDLARSLGVEQSVIFTGFVPYQDLPRYLKLADVAINTLIPSLVAHVAFPNKVLQYLASGLYVASTPLEGLSKVFMGSKNLAWGATPDQVMDRALDYLINLSSRSKETETSRTPENLSRFLPVETVKNFEQALLDISMGKP
jgi:glycosyltransferase involved in cell wall biosynthesis